MNAVHPRSGPSFGKKAWWLAAALPVLSAGLVFQLYAAEEAKAPANKDAEKSKAAFKAAYPVFMHPRCMNCHPAGAAPLQGDDSHPHLQGVKRGPKGEGLYALRCANCHQPANLAGLNMPPGSSPWHMLPADKPQVFEGKSAAELARQLKDPTQNGGKDLEQVYHHIAEDKLVGWGWNPGEGRTKPPLEREEFARLIREWIDNGAEIPD